MAGRMTLWGASELLKSFFSQLSEPPASFYLALIMEVAPTPFLSGAELDEPGYAEYARVEIPNDPDTWTNDGQDHVMTVEVDLTFIPAQQDWGFIRHWAICNAEVEGYAYFVGSFEEPTQVLTGDTVVIPAGNLSIALGPFFSAEDQ